MEYNAYSNQLNDERQYEAIHGPYELRAFSKPISWQWMKAVAMGRRVIKREIDSMWIYEKD